MNIYKVCATFASAKKPGLELDIFVRTPPEERERGSAPMTAECCELCQR